MSKGRKRKFLKSTKIYLFLALSSFRMLEFSSMFKDLSKADLIISSTIPASSSPFLLFLSSEPPPGAVTNSILFLVNIFVKKTHGSDYHWYHWYLISSDQNGDDIVLFCCFQQVPYLGLCKVLAIGATPFRGSQPCLVSRSRKIENKDLFASYEKKTQDGLC